MGMRTSEVKRYVTTCDVPRCKSELVTVDAPENRHRNRFSEEGWKTAHAGDGWSPPTIGDGAALSLCPDHAEMVDALSAVLLITDAAARRQRAIGESLTRLHGRLDEARKDLDGLIEGEPEAPDPQDRERARL